MYSAHLHTEHDVEFLDKPAHWQMLVEHFSDVTVITFLITILINNERQVMELLDRYSMAESSAMSFSIIICIGPFSSTS